jgi:hypothetical protein
MSLELRINVSKGKRPTIGFRRTGDETVEEYSVMESCIRLALKDAKYNTKSILCDEVDSSYCIPFEEGQNEKDFDD